MRDRHSVIGVLSAAACVVAAVLATTAPAQAATPAPERAAAQVLTMPPAPEGASAPSSVAAEPPTTWPKPNKIVHVAALGSVACESGNLCVAAWDSTKGDYAVFYLYHCESYALSNFVGTGGYRNSQTGGATGRFYGQSGNLLTSVPVGASSASYNWSPVWSIRNC
ncbi:hypothetical protein ACIQAC_05290 [Streptomyces sp. NPDC088387]|uniref:hypothetical protein n=1 Tax=Streptomyces sp. NPDC088387 TaxID=3365859 RepID=UPI00381D2AC0